MADSLNSAPIWMSESWHRGRTAQCNVAVREWEHTAEQKSLHTGRFTLRSSYFFSSTTKERKKSLLSEYILYGTVHGPCLNMQIGLVYDCLATMLFHLLPLEGCLPHAWSGAKRLHGNHDNGGTFGRGLTGGTVFLWENNDTATHWHWAVIESIKQGYWVGNNGPLTNTSFKAHLHSQLWRHINEFITGHNAK